MPDRSAKKHQKKLKRKEKSRQLHKAASESVWKAVARGEGELKVWINANWPEARQAQIFAVRTFRGGSNVMGAFLIDFGMPGLKDTWERRNMPLNELGETFDIMAQQDIPMSPSDADEALRLIRGSIRFASDNGFRLPNQFERTVSILGELGDWRSADVSDFDMEFAGSTDELRRRLLHQSVDEFMARDDVRLIIDDGAPSLLSDEELAAAEDDAANKDLIAELTESITEQGMEKVRKWCAETGETPHPQLDLAIRVFTGALATLAIETAGDEQPSDAALQAHLMDRMRDLIDQCVTELGERNTPSLTSAMEQFMRYQASSPSPLELMDIEL